MIKGWNGMQGKVVAMAFVLLGENAKAVEVIRAAIAQNAQWNIYLPAFYFLKDEPGMEGLINEKTFTEKDWSSAVSFLDELNRDSQAEAVGLQALRIYPHSSYLHYLLGEALLRQGNEKEAKKELEQAVSLDPTNDEAVLMLRQTTN